VLARRALPLDEETATWLGVASQPVPTEAETLDEESPWRDVLRYLDPDESSLELLVQQLARQDLPAPVVGYELGDQGWPAELAWPERQVAIVLTGRSDDPETEDRDRAYAEAGWHVRTAREWSVAELAAQIAATSGGERR
jgi:hypothetical protein